MNKISIERSFIISLIFHEKIIENFNVEKLNLEKIIKIASNELVLPLFFYKLKKLKLLAYFPKDFIEYIQMIYDLNYDRNKVLLNELSDLSKIFKKEKISYCLIKGSALLVSDYYENIGNRMIGDIDFMIKKEDISRIEFVLNKNKYKRAKYSFFNNRHLERRTNNEKLFALEPHFKLTDLGDFEIKETISNSVNVNGCCVPNNYNLFLMNVYNSQLNDNNNLTFSYNIKSQYDTHIILNKYNFNKKISLDCKSINNHMFFYNKIISAEKKILVKKISRINRIRYSMRFIPLFYPFEQIMIKLYIVLSKLPKQIIEFLTNPVYRLYSMNKLK